MRKDKGKLLNFLSLNGVGANDENRMFTYLFGERLPKELLNKHFTPKEKGYQINDDIKKCVEFKKHNLLEDKYPSRMHMIVCRNVVIYFTDDAKEHVYKNFHQTLEKDGILFIGNTEQIIHANQIGFSSVDSFFYQKM